jgi:hypothetical protein
MHFNIPNIITKEINQKYGIKTIPRFPTFIIVTHPPKSHRKSIFI